MNFLENFATSIPKLNHDKTGAETTTSTCGHCGVASNFVTRYPERSICYPSLSSSSSSRRKEQGRGAKENDISSASSFPLESKRKRRVLMHVCSGVTRSTTSRTTPPPAQPPSVFMEVAQVFEHVS